MTEIRYRSNEPLISPDALDNIRQVLEDGYLSPGSWTERFEKDWAEVCGVKYCVATSSGTASLHLALIACGIGGGDEVIVPAITCPDTLNAVVFTGAKPVIVDIEPDRLGLDFEKIRLNVTARTKAIIPVHLYGCVVDPDVFTIAEELGLIVIEDVAEAHGATQDGKMAGSLGRAGCFSFRGDKVIGVGMGGAITTDDKALADHVHYINNLASPGGFDRYSSTELCYSYKMSNVHAALGVAQIGMLDKTVAAKRAVAGWYDEFLSDEDCQKPKDFPGHVWWKYTVLLRDGDTREVHGKLLERGIEALPPFTPMYRLPHFSAGYDAADFSVSEELFRRALCLPSSPLLRRDDVQAISGIFRETVQALS